MFYVVSGTGRLHIEDRVETSSRSRAPSVVGRESFTVENTGKGDLVIVLVTAPVEHSTALADDRTVRWDDRPSLPASPNREFRLLVNEDVGCRDITQFVGLIPPGRAPLHSHTYDEVVYVIEGDGLLHSTARPRPSPRACASTCRRGSSTASRTPGRTRCAYSASSIRPAAPHACLRGHRVAALSSPSRVH